MNDNTSQQPRPEEAAYQPAAPRSAQVDRTSKLPAHWPGILALSLGIGAAIWFQSISQEFDHQMANIYSTLSIAVTGLYFLYRLQKRTLAQNLGWYLVPAVLMSICMLGLVLFKFEGFSGEMSPQFSWRFGGVADRELQEVIERPTETTDGATDSATDPTESGEAEGPSSRQFLGNERNGIQAKREFALDFLPEDVERVWDIGIGEGWSSFAVDQGMAITTEQREDVECLTCYRLTDGQLLWIKRNDARHENLMGGIGPRSTPTIDGNRVYATTATGLLWCVDLKSGETIWSKDLLKLAGWDQVGFESAATWGYAVSPLIVDGLCVVSLGGPVEDDGTEPNSLVALDAATGDERWRGGSDQLSYASPMVYTLGGVRQIVSVNEKTASGHRIEDGGQLWSFEWIGQTNGGATCASAMFAGEDRILLGKGYGGGSALVKIRRDGDDWSADPVWTSARVLQTKFNHTCVRGDIGFGIGNGALQAVDLSSAPPKRMWIQPRKSRAGQGQAILCEDALVVQDEGGDVVFVAAEEGDYNELARLPALESKTWNIPTVAGRYLLVRNDRQAICFRLPAIANE